jgi:translocation and assembly module TamA
VVGSVEYERRVRKNWAATVFYDVGNALNSISDPLRYSVGVGARWFSPVGPVRVDLGFPLTEAEDTVRLHITIGPDL